MGQIHPQKNLPKKMVGMIIISDHSSPENKVRPLIAVIREANGSNCKNILTG
jgi:hypothetical protein